MSDMLSLVRSTGLFSGLDPDRLSSMLEGSVRSSHQSGAVVLREGDPADTMYLVLEGAVQVFVERDERTLVLSKVQSGGYFGEQALLPGRDGRRNASVRAWEDTTLLEVSAEDFMRALEPDSELRTRLLREGDEQVRANLAKMHWTRVEVGKQQNVGRDQRSFEISAVDGTKLEAAQPGQHVILQALMDGHWIERPYTLSSRGGRTDGYEITVRRQQQGTLSSWLFEGGAEAGQLRVSPPRGEFTWNPLACPAVCIVGGVGVTPALAMLRTSGDLDGSQALTIDYSAPTRADMAFVDELDEAGRQEDRVAVRLRETDTQGMIGSEDVQALAAKNPGAEYFVCGPTGFQAGVVELLAYAGIERHRIHIETFSHIGDLPRSA